MNELKVENFGPIGKAHVEFGDLTILVGAVSVSAMLVSMRQKNIAQVSILEVNHQYSVRWVE